MASEEPKVKASVETMALLQHNPNGSYFSGARRK